MAGGDAQDGSSERVPLTAPDGSSGAEPLKRAKTRQKTQKGPPAGSRPAQIPHLTGVKTLIAAWIVCHHMIPREPMSGVSNFTMRVDVAVELFMMLSGFLLHYIYAEKDYTGSPGSLIQYYTRRLARTVVTTQFAMVFSLFWWWFGGYSVFTASNAGCLLFVKPWFNPEPNCPNAPTWFIAALLPSQLLYPFVTRRILNVRAVKNSTQGLLILTCAVWFVSIGPQLIMMIAQESWLTWHQVKLTWFWPPAQLADFMLGACVAALLKQAPPPESAGKIADLLFVVLCLVMLLLPVSDTPKNWTGPVFRPGHYMAWDALEGRLASPILAAWIWSSSGGGSYVAQLLSQEVLVSLGAYTFEVYLFQTPLHDLFTWTKEVLWLPGESCEVFILYFFLLWLVSALFVDLLAAPADKWLKGATAEWEGKPFGYFLGQKKVYMSVDDGV